MLIHKTGRSHLSRPSVPKASNGLLDDCVVQALVEDVGEGCDGGPPGHGEQVVVVAAGRHMEEDPLGGGPPVEQHVPYIVLLHQARLLVWHHYLFIPTRQRIP